MIKKFKIFNESFNSPLLINKYWKYGHLNANIVFTDFDLKSWLNEYGDFDVTDIIVEDIKQPVGCLTNIIVNTGFRNKGYGNIILDYYIDTCINNDVNNIILVADKDENQDDGFDLIEWYVSKGFKIINYIYENPVMILEL